MHWKVSMSMVHVRQLFGVRESMNKSAASAGSRDYVKFQAVIKSAAGAASLAEAALVADWITACFLSTF